VGKEPAEAATQTITFSSAVNSSVWSEASGTLTKASPELEAEGFATQIQGASSLELAGSTSWGVFA
jgi:hypothetical protein